MENKFDFGHEFYEDKISENFIRNDIQVLTKKLFSHFAKTKRIFKTNKWNVLQMKIYKTFYNVNEILFCYIYLVFHQCLTEKMI